MSAFGFNIGAVRLDNPLVLAPMAGVTDLPFRLLAKEHGAALTMTEMVSAAGLCLRSRKTFEMMETTPAERPLAVQLFGSRPEWLARGAALAQEAGADIIDLNLGCPARKVVRHGAGAALLRDFRRVREILVQVRPAVTVPLTVKTRAGWRPGENGVLELIPLLADFGVDALTLHPRYAVQGFGGRADWDLIARAVRAFPGPVIGNGDVTRPEHARAMLETTGCAGVMIGRGALGNPWIFDQTLSGLEGRPRPGPDLDERLRTALAHARMLGRRIGPGKAVFPLRSVLMWYTKGLPESSVFRRSINQVRDFDLLLGLLQRYFESLAAPPRLEAAGA
ncbi:MAG: tRNA dihydrouridine synthase DusB [Thermodesulfobacteriota bacterium]